MFESVARYSSDEVGTVRLLATAGTLLMVAGMVGGAGLAEYGWDRYSQRENSITPISSTQFIQSQIWPKY